MERYPCRRLGVDVELTDERRAHIESTHVDAAVILARLPDVLARPDLVMWDAVGRSWLVARRFDAEPARRHIVAIVVQDDGSPETARYWVVTAYAARRLAQPGSRWELK